jgi:hypothetical protein
VFPAKIRLRTFILKKDTFGYKTLLPRQNMPLPQPMRQIIPQDNALIFRCLSSTNSKDAVLTAAPEIIGTLIAIKPANEGDSISASPTSHQWSLI